MLAAAVMNSASNKRSLLIVSASKKSGLFRFIVDLVESSSNSVSVCGSYTIPVMERTVNCFGDARVLQHSKTAIVIDK